MGGVSSKDTLAIIIPAYKDSFLKETLESLCSQSDRDFNVYIGDDNSPHDLESIVRQYYGRLNVRYVRFDNNIGAKSLVSQWERCVDLMQNEDWIWVLGDDDIAESNCVREFRNSLDSTSRGHDIYSFNTTIIDRHGAIISTPPVVPVSETSVDYAYNLLLNKRANCMSDHIFSAAAYKRNGGFIHTDYAQGADWINTIVLAKDRGIRHIQNAVVLWRYSGSNISSLAYTQKAETIKGFLQFTQGVLDHFSYLKDRESSVTFRQMSDAALWNLEFVLTTHYRGIDLRNILPILFFIKRRFKRSFWATFKILVAINSKAPRLRVKNLLHRLPFLLKVRNQT